MGDFFVGHPRYHDPAVAPPIPRLESEREDSPRREKQLGSERDNLPQRETNRLTERDIDKERDKYVVFLEVFESGTD